MTLLRIRDLCKIYETPDGERQTVLDVPEFSMDEREEIALAGTSGSGKTTFLHLIAGILRPDGGSIELAGQRLSDLSEAARDAHRARYVGYVFQTFNLLQGYTALENVMLGMMFGPGADRNVAKDLLEKLGMGHRLDYRPAQLSIGQQQRVALARALANRPRLVLADEPTGNLDAAHGADALALIRQACRDQDAALLLVSHDPAVLRQFDRVLDLAELNRAHAGPAQETA